MENIIAQTRSMIDEFFELSNLKENSILVVGGSSSEVDGETIGKNSNYEVAQAIVKVLFEQCKKRNVYLAVQCCEHLNRALVVEKECAEKFNLEIVNVKPAVKAGGGFATSASELFNDFVCVEFIKADGGIDIGDTLIGMHLKHVAVPLRPKNNAIGKARVAMAKTRAKYIGGPRAQY